MSNDTPHRREFPPHTEKSGIHVNKIFILFFRRMRAPLLVLIAVYGLSIGGLVLMPGVDDQGNPWRLDFFHAFYFVSYTAPTIGFGEIPYPFSPQQRLWSLVSIYLTVIGWFYAIGTILTLVQDQTFRRAWAEWRFVSSVGKLGSPFYLICGYGDSGRLLVQALADRGQRCVVIDSDPEAIYNLLLEDLPFVVPYLCADAGESAHLRAAGIEHPNCVALVAVTETDETNLRIAITSKLLNRKLKVIACARSTDTMKNLGSFNTDHIINPFYTFAEHLTRALHSPLGYGLYTLLTTRPATTPEEISPPPRGTWIICGYGRFGKLVKRHFDYEGVSTVIIEPDPEGAGAPEGCIRGRGTEAVTLREAGIDKAVGIVAGSDDDSNNLSIIMTARDLKPGLYVVGRQNRFRDHELFHAANVDLVMRSSSIIVRHILSLVMTPLTDRFLRQARHQDEDWAQALLDAMRPFGEGFAPDTWAVSVTSDAAPALTDRIASGDKVSLEALSRHPRDRDKHLPCLALLHLGDGGDTLLPPVDTVLRPGDQILYCGMARTGELMDWSLANPRALDYVITGRESPEGLIWRWLESRRCAVNADTGE